MEEKTFKEEVSRDKWIPLFDEELAYDESIWSSSPESDDLYTNTKMEERTKTL